MSFTIFDIIIITIITVSSISGLFRGFIRVTFGFIGFFLSILIAYHIEPFCRELLSEYISQDIALVIISGAAAYLISLLVIGFITHGLYKLLESVSGGRVVDGILGTIAGFVRGNIISLMIFMITAIITSGSYIKAKSLEDIYDATTRDRYPPWLQKSLTLDFLEKQAHKIVSMVPQDTLKSTIIFKDQKDLDTYETIDKITRERKALDKKQGSDDDELDDQLEQMLPKE